MKKPKLFKIVKGLFFSEDFAKVPNCIIYIKKGFIMKLDKNKNNKRKK